MMQMSCVILFVVGITGYTTLYDSEECVEGRHAHLLKWESEVEVNIRPFDQMDLFLGFFDRKCSVEQKKKKLNHPRFHVCLIYFRLQ